MASSKVMMSLSSANSDLARQSSVYSLTVSELQNGQSKNFGSMNMDELLKNIYGDNPAVGEIIPNATTGTSNGDGESNGGIPNVGNKSVEEVWKDIIVASAGSGGVDRKLRGVDDGQFYKDPAYEEMTLEDFLAKAGAVREEDVRVTQAAGPSEGVFPVDSMLSNRFQQQQQQQPQQPQIDGSVAVFGNGVERTGQGRGKKRVVEEPVDKVAEQRQRRMIKNRESAARSRERKQAYTVELESLVAQLEEENARLLREQEEEKKKRIKQLMENVIPVLEKRRPPRVLRRVRSMQW